MHDKIISVWKSDLLFILTYLENKTLRLKYFKGKLFLFFLVVNIFFYWFAMLTAFPELVFGKTFSYYFKIQFPVGILGSIFDSSSFFITLFIIKRAIKTSKSYIYVGHLSIDLLIAILATFWVVFVFILSGWIVNQIDLITLNGQEENYIAHTYEFEERTNGYNNLVKSAIKNPVQNLSNIYFGFIMGLSAMIPTLIHILMFFKSFLNAVYRSRFFKK